MPSSLYQELHSSRFGFMPRGRHHISDIYAAVHEKFASLCNDDDSCPHYESKGVTQPEWQHITRSVLAALKDSKGGIFHSGQRKTWLFFGESFSPEASDLSEPSPARVTTEVYRVLRDTELVRRIKELHHNYCQICGHRIELSDGVFYSEGHHIKPLGSPHNGPDSKDNILILCPNHHAMCDYGAIYLEAEGLRLVPGHTISQKHIDYHNRSIAQNKTVDTR